MTTAFTAAINANKPLVRFPPTPGPQKTGPAATQLKKTKDHWAFNRSQFISGMIGKIVAECPVNKLDPKIAKKLLFLNTMLWMSFSTEWTQVL